MQGGGGDLDGQLPCDSFLAEKARHKAEREVKRQLWRTDNPKGGMTG